MSRIKALVVGVSDYSLINQVNLPFCLNDIDLVAKSLIEGLNAEEENIEILGKEEIVPQSTFINIFNSVLADLNVSDTFILYFSGHGGNLPTGHHLLFSDDVLKTQNIIELLDRAPARNKILILDCCMAGNFEVNQTTILSTEMNISEFLGVGYAVFASSNSIQCSYGHPDKSVSLFTSFLCETITDKHLIKKGNKTLNDIQRLLFFYLEIWNKNNPDMQQNPIFRANIGGTITFPVENYTPYQIEKYYEETAKYIIYDVQPVHSEMAKRYSVKVILKEPFLFEEIAEINCEIIDKIKKLEIYTNINSEKRWSGKTANIIYGYFGRDEFDITNSNFICITIWGDNTQDKSSLYKGSKNSAIINQIFFDIQPYYSSLRVFTQENTGEKDLLIAQTKEIISHLITLAEEVIKEYKEFLNRTIDECELIENLNPILISIEKWYGKKSNLDISPGELKEWSQACSNIAATIHDFTLFYNEKYLLGRTSDNRKACMDMTVKKYYENLEAIKNLETNLE